MPIIIFAILDRQRCWASEAWGAGRRCRETHGDDRDQTTVLRGDGTEREIRSHRVTGGCRPAGGGPGALIFRSRCRLLTSRESCMSTASSLAGESFPPKIHRAPSPLPHAPAFNSLYLGLHVLTHVTGVVAALTRNRIRGWAEFSERLLEHKHRNRVRGGVWRHFGQLLIKIVLGPDGRRLCHQGVLSA